MFSKRFEKKAFKAAVKDNVKTLTERQSMSYAAAVIPGSILCSQRCDYR